jgi:hypothetical protein
MTHEVVDPYKSYNERVSGNVKFDSGFLHLFRPAVDLRRTDSRQLILGELMRFDCGVLFRFKCLLQTEVRNSVRGQSASPLANVNPFFVKQKVKYLSSTGTVPSSKNSFKRTIAEIISSLVRLWLIAAAASRIFCGSPPVGVEQTQQNSDLAAHILPSPRLLPLVGSLPRAQKDRILKAFASFGFLCQEKPAGVGG